MKFLINFDNVKSGWSIVYIEGLTVIISIRYLSFSEILILSYQTSDPGDMPPYAAFHFLKN